MVLCCSHCRVFTVFSVAARSLLLASWWCVIYVSTSLSQAGFLRCSVSSLASLSLLSFPPLRFHFMLSIIAKLCCFPFRITSINALSSSTLLWLSTRFRFPHHASMLNTLHHPGFLASELSIGWWRTHSPSPSVSLSLSLVNGTPVITQQHIGWRCASHPPPRHLDTLLQPRTLGLMQREET